MKFKALLIGLLGAGVICFLVLMAKSRVALVAAVNAEAQTSQESAPPVPLIQLPGKGLAQHPFLYCGEWDTRQPVQTMYIVRGGKVVWWHSVPNQDELDDIHLLSNGNILFARKGGATEITQDKKVVWNYDAPPGTEIHSAQPIAEDKVLFTHVTQSRFGLYA